ASSLLKSVVDFSKRDVGNCVSPKLLTILASSSQYVSVLCFDDFGERVGVEKNAIHQPFALSGCDSRAIIASSTIASTSSGSSAMKPINGSFDALATVSFFCCTK